MDSEKILIKEYDFLRLEIQKKTDSHRTLVLFAVTTTVTILALAFIVSRPIIALFPFLILIPISVHINHLRNGIAKIAAYLIVHIESHIDGLNWETRNSDLFMSKKTSSVPFPSNSSNLRNWECFFLGIISSFAYLLSTYNNDSQIVDHLLENWWLSIPLAILFVSTIIPATLDEQRSCWIDYWSGSLKKNLSLTASQIDGMLCLYVGHVVAIFLYAILNLPQVNILGLPTEIISIIQTLTFYFVLFFVARLARRKSRNAYSADAIETMLCVQLLSTALCFFICGFFLERESCKELLLITLSLFVGSFVSLGNAIETDNIWSGFTEIFANSGISRKMWKFIAFFTGLTLVVNVLVIYCL